MKAARALSLTLALLGLSCLPDEGAPISRIDRPRLLAVRADPPEALPGETVRYEALLVTPEGRATDPEVTWAFCDEPKPLGENNAVSAACLSDDLPPLAGHAAIIEAPTPDDACALFGPDAPPGDFRPRDPDVTGGYYQPLRLAALGLTGVALERVTCDLAAAPIDRALAFKQRYRKNRPPVLDAFHASLGGAEVSLDHVPPDVEIGLRVSWGEDDRETFVVYDADKVALVEQVETLRLSWFVTGGSLEAGVTGAEGAESSNRWRSPQKPGVVRLWVVLRDSRGGLDFAERTLAVGP